MEKNMQRAEGGEGASRIALYLRRLLESRQGPWCGFDRFRPIAGRKVFRPMSAHLIGEEGWPNAQQNFGSCQA